MDGELWWRVRTLFPRLVEVGAVERAAWLDEHCAGDAQLREELERLLAADGESSGWLSPAPSLEDLLREQTLGLNAGATVGAYRLLEPIGAGGMGAVWLAEQTQPRRLVALKTLRAEASGAEALKRFRAEAELVGHLRHPGIAQVFDAGACTVDGRELPYLVMEYVEGSRNLMEAADALGLDRRGRLRLLAEVCDAVHHGHQRGVIHRDLKPGNVLVDPDGRPKVIDFGLARALDPALLGISLARTRAGDVFGTIPYMSPEQVGGRLLEVDARSDVYALGCLACELLTGRPPLALEGSSLPEIARRIAEEEPHLDARLPAELRWILAKALEKDPARRYPSASELAADLRRVLESRPVLAGPPSSLYQMTRFARRHRLALLACAAVVSALLVGLVQARAEARAAELARAEALAASFRAEEARALADRQAELARTASFFLSDLFESSGVYERGQEARVIDAIEVAESRLATIEDPTARAVLTGIVGRAYVSLDERARGAPLVERAVAVLRETLPPDDLFRLGTEVVLADLLERDQRFAESRALSEDLLPRLEAAHGPDHTLTLYLRFNLAVCCFRTDELDEAERLFRRNLELTEERWPEAEAASRRRDLLHWLGNTLVGRGDTDGGVELLAQALELERATSGGAGSNEPTLHMDIGRAWMNAGEPELALIELEEAERLYRSTSTAASQRFSIALNLASCLRALDRIDEAELRCAEAARALAEGWSRPGVRHVLLASMRAQLALEQDEPERAAAHARAALELARELRPEGSSDEANALELLAHALVDLDDRAGAAQAAGRSLELTPPDAREADRRRALLLRLEPAAPDDDR